MKRGDGSGRLVTVRRLIEDRGAVTLRAHRVARCAQLQRVGIVTVGAGDALAEHLTLHKGPEFKILGIDLSIGAIDTRLDQLRQVIIQQGMAHGAAIAQGLTPRVTGETDLRLGPRIRKRTTRRGDPLRRARETPLHGLTGMQRHTQALAGIGARAAARPLQMFRRGAVTGLAGDIKI